MNSDYRFIINADGIDPQIVYPAWSSDALFEDAPESGQVFLRTKFSGNLSFEEEDFQYIHTRSIETEFFLDISERQQDGSYLVVFVGRFTKSDCDIDEDDERADVTPEASDDYRLIMNGLDKEFNLIDLAPAITELDYVVRPIFQVYTVINAVPSTVLTNIYGGIQFEQDVPNPPGPILDPLLDDYFFGKLGDRIVLACDSFDPVVPSEYISEANVFFPDYRARSIDGTHRIELNTGTGDYELKRISDGTILYILASGQSFVKGQFVSQSSGKIAESNIATFFGRMITGQESVNAQPTNLLPDEDFVQSASAYQYALPLGVIGIGASPLDTHWQDLIIGSFDNSAEPDEYEVIDGLYFDGNYFNKPTGLGNGQIHALQQSLWTNVSFWFQYTDELRALETGGGKSITLKHAYKIEDVLSVLINAIDPSLSFDRSALHSDFLFNNSNPIRSQPLWPMITPKSNILVGEYELAAQQAPIKLSEVLTLAAIVWKCKFRIVGSRFTLEHEEYFEKGLSYVSDQIGVDFTTITDPASGRPWAWKTAKYTFQKENLPVRMEFSWMDNASNPFKGYPIDVLSKFVNQSKTDPLNVARFYSDVDFAQIDPSQISGEGFFFFEAQLVSDRYSLPIVELTANGETFFAQNGYASFIYIHDKYYRHQLPAPLVTINNEQVTASSVIKSRIQPFEGPSDVDFDKQLLITTTLGNGKIRSASRKLDKGGIRFTFAHNNES